MLQRHSPTPVVSCSPDYGDLFTIGDNVVTCTGIDDAGNTGSTSFTVTVLPGVETSTAVVQHGIGSGTPGCETTNSCYAPYQTSINIADSVKCENNDNNAHSVISGTHLMDQADIGTAV